MSNPETPGRWTRLFARRSESCPVCRCARAHQRGLAFWVVKNFEVFCPFCRAYEKVHGRKSHEAPDRPLKETL